MALDEELYIKLQPIFNVEVLSVNYVEVLIRKHGETLDIANMLDRLEKSNKGMDLDMFVIKKASEVIRENPTYKSRINVNICKSTLESEMAYGTLLGVLDKEGVSYDRIVFEINEDTRFDNQNVINNIRALARKGICIAIDDFGKGNTSLQFISRMPIRMVKFDKVYLRDTNISIANKLVSSMHYLGIDTVIEGVETAEHLEMARRIGYNNIQGYIVSRPISTDWFKLMYT